MALTSNDIYGVIDERFTCEYIAREALLLLMYFGKRERGSYGAIRLNASPRDSRIIDYWGLNRNTL